jgi:hypothetical protein
MCWVSTGAGAPIAFPHSIYFFNHIHSNDSHDNPSLKWFKKSPMTIFKSALRYLKSDQAEGMIAITDHNSDISYDQLLGSGLLDGGNPGLTTVRAAEWGLRTHMGLLNLPSNWAPLQEPAKYSGLGQVEAADGTGALRIVNHPGFRGKEWRWQDWGQAEAVEVWNGPIHPPRIAHAYFGKIHNDQTIQQWVESLKAGFRYTAVTGTDFHFKIPFTRSWTYMLFPANLVFAADNSPDTVLSAIRQGRVSLQLSPSAPKLYLRAAWAGQDQSPAELGGSLNGEGRLQAEVLLEAGAHSKRNVDDEIWVYRGLKGDLPVLKIPAHIPSKSADNPLKLCFSVSVEQPAQPDFIRVELRGHHGRDLLGLTNPIYLNPALK